MIKRGNNCEKKKVKCLGKNGKKKNNLNRGKIRVPTVIH
jgi:hypothetical protein